MAQGQGRMFDEFAKLMTDAAGLAQGARREVETVVRAQGDRLVSEMDLVRRSDLDIVQDMATKALAEVGRLSLQVAELEARIAATSGASQPATAAEAGPAGEGTLPTPGLSSEL